MEGRIEKIFDKHLKKKKGDDGNEKAEHLSTRAGQYIQCLRYSDAKTNSFKLI